MPRSGAWGSYYDFYLDGKPAPPLREKFLPDSSQDRVDSPWLVRGGKLKKTPDGLQVIPSGNTKKQSPFITRNGVKLNGPVIAKVILKTTGKGAVGFAWRNSNEKDFTPEHRLSMPVKESTEWQTVATTIPVDSKIIHVRILLPNVKTTIQSIEITPAKGNPLSLDK